jgi:hypothetical protein
MTKKEAGMTKKEAGMKIKKEAGMTNEKNGKGPGMTFLRWDDK